MANYLPVLLVPVNTNSIPDDSAVSTLPRGQVDYLSHNWEEEDVWRSWRNMTRQKHEIANGIRLENASWRTWWKQRNKLKTVTPETLNWLKDSDVTWLYGPLHTAVDWTPPPKPDPISVDDKNPASAHDRLDLNMGTGGMKPILKHRSISELLTSDLPSSPVYSSAGSDTEKGDEAEEDVWIQDRNTGDPGLKGSRSRHQLKRPPLLHTKSDTHLTRGPNRAFGRGSPPRITTEGSAATPLTPGSTTSRSSYALDRKSSQPSQTSGSDQDPSSSLGSNGHGKKKHITFNTFVEQCIAIEKPKNSQDSSTFRIDTPRNSNSRIYDSGYDDGYDEDTESSLIEEEDDVLFNSSPPEQSQHDHFASHSNSDSDDDEDDDEVLEIRTTSIRQRASPGRSSSSSSSSGSSRSPSSGAAKRYNSTPMPSTRSLRYGPALLRTPSVEKAHMTILPIAPTILKTKGVGNGAEADDDYEYPVSAGDGATWYGAGTDVPVHLVYVPPLGSNYCMDSSDLQGGDDVYRHREAYFSVGTGGGMDISVPSVGITPSPPSGQATMFYQTPLVASPANGNGAEEDAYDYFEGPDLGVAFADKRTHSQPTVLQEVHDTDTVNVGRPDMVKYVEGGAVSVVSPRSNGAPQVVVKGVNGVVEEGRERSRSRSRSRSRTPSPGEFSTPSTSSIPLASPVVTVPRVASSHSIEQSLASSSNGSLLSPPDIGPSRGRSSTPVSESHSRGRSATRNSSFSDRERSSSRGTSSPIGSISPEGSAVGIAIGSAYGVYANGRDRELTARKGRGERGRIGRKDQSASVDDVRTSSLGRFGDGRRVASNSPASSGSSTVSAASTAVPTHGSSPLRISTDSSDLGSAMTTPMPTPIPANTEEEQVQRSRHPTPANSPVSTMKLSLPVPPPQLSSASTTVPHSSKGIVGPPGSPTSVKALEDGTLVGRAVASAGAFLGSIWQGNART